jgi:hypothetical protein
MFSIIPGNDILFRKYTNRGYKKEVREDRICTKKQREEFISVKDHFNFNEIK